MYHIRLVKLGYGSLREVKEMSAREVIQALCYEDFLDDYENAIYQLNKGKE